MSVTVQIITIAEGADSDPRGSLSEPLLSSLLLCFLSLSLCVCMYICHLGRGALGLPHAVSAMHHAKLTLCNAFMPTEPSLELMMPVAVW